MDPECELANRENTEWRMHVDTTLDMICRALYEFKIGRWTGKLTNITLNKLADALGDLGWRGNRIPF